MASSFSDSGRTSCHDKSAAQTRFEQRGVMGQTAKRSTIRVCIASLSSRSLHSTRNHKGASPSRRSLSAACMSSVTPVSVMQLCDTCSSRTVRQESSSIHRNSCFARRLQAALPENTTRVFILVPRYAVCYLGHGNRNMLQSLLVLASTYFLRGWRKINSHI